MIAFKTVILILVGLCGFAWIVAAVSRCVEGIADWKNGGYPVEK